MGAAGLGAASHAVVRMPRSSAQPGADDRVGKAHPVAEDSRLLRMAVEALLNGDRDLLGGDAALDRLDHELGGVELLLAQDELGEDGGADGAVAVGAVADVGTGDEGGEAVGEEDAGLAGGGGVVGGGGGAGAGGRGGRAG